MKLWKFINEKWPSQMSFRINLVTSQCVDLNGVTHRQYRPWLRRALFPIFSRWNASTINRRLVAFSSLHTVPIWSFATIFIISTYTPQLDWCFIIFICNATFDSMCNYRRIWCIHPIWIILQPLLFAITTYDRSQRAASTSTSSARRTTSTMVINRTMASKARTRKKRRSTASTTATDK